jgi:hypothetical protein
VISTIAGLGHTLDSSGVEENSTNTSKIDLERLANLAGSVLTEQLEQSTVPPASERLTLAGDSGTQPGKAKSYTVMVPLEGDREADTIRVRTPEGTNGSNGSRISGKEGEAQIASPAFVPSSAFTAVNGRPSVAQTSHHSGGPETPRSNPDGDRAESRKGISHATSPLREPRNHSQVPPRQHVEILNVERDRSPINGQDRSPYASPPRQQFSGPENTTSVSPQKRKRSRSPNVMNPPAKTSRQEASSQAEMARDERSQVSGGASYREDHPYTTNQVLREERNRMVGSPPEMYSRDTHYAPVAEGVESRDHSSASRVHSWSQQVPSGSQMDRDDEPRPYGGHSEAQLAAALQRDVLNMEVDTRSRSRSGDSNNSDDRDSKPAHSTSHHSPDGQNMSPQPAQPDPRRARKRVFSNRTKTGCMTCRRRKKKCDEKRPECKISLKTE